MSEPRRSRQKRPAAVDCCNFYFRLQDALSEDEVTPASRYVMSGA
ncbi:hypothetical protein CNE_1c17640 [Cupriavidus necator N-1]|uniref:Uncharacterized protein n=1 Tax=Cupriavidus necator (strain ATCC 43291 / DSM 13513 / CCUG 52238 / LMG 8453 / N-1) TaxID=1042878 RepID=G0EWB0_CUPNN|nr:hypothetical protein CNE_1c17640 [Cupriavidus necator N-1]